jgi:cell division protein FtsI/penicillin-binding protein 2
MNRRRRSFFSAWRFSRDMVFYLLLALTVAVIIGRLFVLQVVDYDQYLTQADENRITRLNDPAPRGVIYDRRGVLLARNLPSFVVPSRRPICRISPPRPRPSCAGWAALHL